MSSLSQWFSSCASKDVFLCFSETWIKPDNPPITIPGFRIFLSPFIRHPGEHRLAGYLPGSCICVPDSLSIEQTPLCKDIENSCKLLNVVCCLIACRFSKVAIASVYRSPSICPNDCLVEINDMFSQLLQVSSSVIVVGDFNFDLLSASCSQRRYTDILTFVLFNMLMSLLV